MKIRKHIRYENFQWHKNYMFFTIFMISKLGMNCIYRKKFLLMYGVIYVPYIIPYVTQENNQRNYNIPK